MNELEKKRLEKAKPELPISLVEEVQKQLDAFRDSSQFQMLGGVHLAQFFSDPKAVPESLKIKTIEELVEEGAIALGAEPEITKEHLSEILIILSRFLPEKDEVPDHAPKGSAPSGKEVISLQRQGRIDSDVPVFSSVEAERKLVERYTRLKASQFFDTLKYKKVGDFWDTATIRAPFLEELTFRELLEVSVDHLLKKRSVGNTKVYCLVKAFDLLFLEEEAMKVGSGGAGENVQTMPQMVRAIPPLRWKRLEPEVSPLLKAIVDRWEIARTHLLSSASPTKGLIRAAAIELPEKITQEQFLILWFASERRLQELSGLLKKDVEVLEEIAAESREIAISCLEQTAPKEVKWLLGVLKGIGVAEEELLFPLQDSDVEDHICLAVLRISLHSLNAFPPMLNGLPYPGYWTLKPDGLQQILMKIAQSSSRKEQEELLETLAPQFPPEVLLEALMEDAKE